CRDWCRSRWDRVRHDWLWSAPQAVADASLRLALRNLWRRKAGRSTGCPDRRGTPLGNRLFPAGHGFCPSGTSVHDPRMPGP
nr:hypothetical protein [Tanacetum cinerariifolium]